MSTILIAGASRGIGLELAKQYAAAGDNVIACARDTGAAALLDEAASNAENITILALSLIHISEPTRRYAMWYARLGL